MTLLQTFRRRRRDALGSFSTALPLEIHFAIIDQFEGHTVQLRELCRICRAWAAHAQALLFRHICVRYNDIERFLAVLDTEHNLGRHVMSLKISEKCRPLDPHPYIPRLLEELDHAFSKQLPSVRTLDISYKVFGGSMDGATPHPSPGWAAISCLNLRFCRFATTDTMLAFIAAFPRLESLDVFQCSTKDGPPVFGWTPLLTGVRSPGSVVMPPWHLKYLALGQFPQNPLIDWMVSEPAALAVDHLRILSLGPDASAFNALLTKIGGGLRHLELPGMHRWADGHQVPLSIRACTALTALSFSERSAYDLGRAILSVLAQVTSASLTTVSFHVPLSAGYLDVPWEQVAARLAADADAFARLERVVFHICQQWGSPVPPGPGGAHWPPGLTRYEMAVLLMEDRMVLLQARGLLRFVDADDDENRDEMALSPPPWATYASVTPPPARTASLRQRLSRRLGGWIGRRGISIPLRTM
ncbi:hypothetical protein GGX14DRAFT_454341 [Mycena pura]|uniref:F-box domain-containing protein n=1 Tax=Mycena pura TaxID=153505 RepID=A0AAD6VC19_9AGAR|nr:hypothetical protein GGX14DRAFT_454341 [Mycena pura]